MNKEKRKSDILAIGFAIVFTCALAGNVVVEGYKLYTGKITETRTIVERYICIEQGC